MAQNYHTVTWDMFYEDARTLTAKLEPQGPWEGIIAIARGGLVTAQILAYELDIKLIDTICISSYNEQTQREAQILKSSVEGTGKNFLLVDELSDTGKTAQLVQNLMPDIHTAVVYTKPRGTQCVDTYVREVPQNVWILFPWDPFARELKKGKG